MPTTSPRRLQVLAFALLAAAPLTPTQIVVEGDCTLVDAIEAANQDAPVGDCPAGSGNDEVVLTADVVLTESFDGQNGLPRLTSGITLVGNGFEISREPTSDDFRILEVPDSEFDGRVELVNVTLSGGSLPTGDGGAISVRTRSAEVILNNTTLSGNRARRGGGLFIGQGGYLSYGQVEVSHSRFFDNYAAGGGGGIYKAYGGYLDLVASTLAGNISAGRGGGLSTTGGWYPFGQPGFATVAESTFHDNTASHGGGIRAVGGLTITNSTISGNHATTAGGGLYLLTGNYLPNSIRFTTITDNTADTGVGGGLFNLTSDFSAAPLEVESSIIAGNADSNCGIDVLELDSSGANFEDDSTCANDWGFMTGLDPNLEDNGGPTSTHALLDGSSAIDTNPCSVSTDQRGFLRDDGACDAGAFENGADVLAVEGHCPGPIVFSTRGAAPSSRVKIFEGLEPGESLVPSGPCSGTEFGVTGPRALGLFLTDSQGDGSLTIDVSRESCGRFAQGVSEPSCVTTKVVQIDDVCNFLGTNHSGEGSNPLVEPASSAECTANRYLEGEVLTLTAFPSPGWGVGSWNGTDDDSSTSEINELTMPSEAHVVSVDYIQVCKPLTLSKTGNGANPQATPANSAGCPDRQYVPGELIQFFGADPQNGWAIGGWTGTDNDSSTRPTNTLTMPDVDFHVVTVDYVLDPLPQLIFSGTCPGEIVANLSNLRPDRTAAVYAGLSGGTTQIADGACAGTELDLSGAQRWKTLSADSFGEATFTFTATAGWCARSAQAVDFDCRTGNVADIP